MSTQPEVDRGGSTADGREHALDFILPIEPRYGVRSVARRLWSLADTDEGVASRFASIQERINSGKPLIGKDHYALYERMKNEGVPTLDIPTAPEWIRPAFAAAYLRAKAAVASGQGRGLYGDARHIESVLDSIIEQLEERVESSFAGELVAETMLAAYKDPEFARTLQRGADEFRALAEELYGPEGTDRPGAVARMSGGSGGGGDCTCCANTPDGSDCRPCSCWIIVVIIVIIVVTK